MNLVCRIAIMSVVGLGLYFAENQALGQEPRRGDEQRERGPERKAHKHAQKAGHKARAHGRHVNRKQVMNFLRQHPRLARELMQHRREHVRGHRAGADMRRGEMLRDRGQRRGAQMRPEFRGDRRGPDFRREQRDRGPIDGGARRRGPGGEGMTAPEGPRGGN